MGRLLASGRRGPPGMGQYTILPPERQRCHPYLRERHEGRSPPVHVTESTRASCPSFQNPLIADPHLRDDARQRPRPQLDHVARAARPHQPPARRSLGRDSDHPQAGVQEQQVQREPHPERVYRGNAGQPQAFPRQQLGTPQDAPSPRPPGPGPRHVGDKPPRRPMPQEIEGPPPHPNKAQSWEAGNRQSISPHAPSYPEAAATCTAPHRSRLRRKRFGEPQAGHSARRSSGPSSPSVAALTRTGTRVSQQKHV